MFGRVLDMDRDYAVGAVYGLVLVVLVVLSPVLPRAVGLAGPLVCPDGQTDTFVTTELVEPADAPGVRSTDIGVSLFCMGERGDVTEVGILRPVTALAGSAVLVTLAVIASALGLRRIGRRALGRR
jgi:hypothetical protein